MGRSTSEIYLSGNQSLLKNPPAYTGSTELALKSLQCRLQETLGPLVSRKRAAVTTGVVSATWNWRISRLVSITL
ncbi:uncharacterized protein LOC121394621 isoform X2 [Xenopus laevis]|uniref:Uncharacterized protein LOC121394621 isoform X2 n=1 Tax=Xenopus laevis TaxID=8355 RepID=A0A8J1KXF5_XENLA|nr:uncharacterized protein LOC121394621 isoform X2 [Xenopus laevis]XP_041421993.1 uncharacterized protein LOC121394621 isoform X2 [Xenopus laevis]